MSRFSPALAWALLAISAAAGCGGTETGNPTLTPTNTGEPTTVALEILSTICGKLTSCYPSLSDSSCRAGILASSGIDTELGLPANFGTYQSIVQAEQNGQITASDTAIQCLSDLSSLSCSSSSVTQAYSPAAPGDFSNVQKLIPTSGTSCAGVY